MKSRLRRTALLLALGMFMACGENEQPLQAPPAKPQRDWQRTEQRADCTEYNRLRTPFFGEQHIHTAYSFDATMARVRNTPRDAYAFAKGSPVGLPPYDANGQPTRTAQLRRPLDWAAVTDHSEFLGEMQMCKTPGSAGYDSPECAGLRSLLIRPPEPPAPSPPFEFLRFGTRLIVPAPRRFSWCGNGGTACLAQAALIWQDEQAAAEQHYDRTSSCGFTSFVAYEWTNNLANANLHRNVIFRNDEVPDAPVSYFEQPQVQGLWAALQSKCLDKQKQGGRCDFMTIPHNSNASMGMMFVPENADGSTLTAADARARAAYEPLVEIYQHKGESECRLGVGGATDEECNFEKLDRMTLVGPANPMGTFAPRAFVRNVLKEGLAIEQRIGVNPFRLGFVGATDTHNGIPGHVNEADFAETGHLGTQDGSDAFRLSPYPLGGIEAGSGGLTVLWAEENSRDALFAAMRRREAYATSGPRPIVRLFAGSYPKTLCDDPEFVQKGYQSGVPMGGEIGAVNGSQSLQLAVMAQRDPGGNGEPSTPLQRIQIIKGWVDASATPQEKVYDVAGSADTGAAVDLTTCQPTGQGFDTLCTVWEDPDFHQDQLAFYYARVLENPTCRWSTYLCNKLGVDCSKPESVPADYAGCCAPRAVKTIQERAWTSPVWYHPQ